MRAAHGGGRRQHGVPRGRPASGARYFLTTAMLPAHKESVRRHPVKFLVGVLLHAGLILALALLLLLALRPALALRALPWAQPPLLLALACGLYLASRRALSATLRFMSTPDDYLAILASCGLLIAMVAAAAHSSMPAAALLYAAALLLYLPLGKLRHAAFFFAARLDYGRRLGYRGVYPPPAAGTRPERETNPPNGAIPADRAEAAR